MYFLRNKITRHNTKKCVLSSFFAMLLLLIPFASFAESRPNSQSRNLITIIPGGINSSTRRMNTLPDANFLISSPSEQYPQFRKRQFFKQSGQYAPYSPYSNIEASNNADSDSLHQDIPLYRDEGTSSFSKRYLTSESSSSGYSVKGGYNKQPASNSFSGYGGQVIPAAIQTKHQVSYYDVPSTSEPAKPTTIEVGASSVPLNILFRSASSNLNIQQAHEGSHGTTQETESHDEPHYLKHQVIKPIYQEVKEVIQPIRYIKQSILPVQETIETIVAREGGKKYNTPSKTTEHSEYAGSTRNSYQTVEQRYEASSPPPSSPPTIVTSSVQHLVQAPEYQQPSSQVASIVNVHEQVAATHNSYQPETTAAAAANRRSSTAEEEEFQQVLVPTGAAAATEAYEAADAADFQQHQQQLIDQIGHEYMAASSSALLSSVYGVSASTSPSSSSSGSGSGAFRQQQQFITPAASTVQSQQLQQPTSAPGSIQLNEYSTIDADLVNQYLPLVYEVINSMENGGRAQEEEGGSGPV